MNLQVGFVILIAKSAKSSIKIHTWPRLAAAFSRGPRLDGTEKVLREASSPVSKPAAVSAKISGWLFQRTKLTSENWVVHRFSVDHLNHFSGMHSENAFVYILTLCRILPFSDVNACTVVCCMMRCRTANLWFHAFIVVFLWHILCGENVITVPDAKDVKSSIVRPACRTNPFLHYQWPALLLQREVGCPGRPSDRPGWVIVFLSTTPWRTALRGFVTQDSSVNFAA